MAAPTFVGAGTGVIILSGAADVAPDGVAIADGDLVILQILQDGTGSGPTLGIVGAGLRNIAGTASALTQIFDPIGNSFHAVGSPAAARHWLWIGRKQGAGSTSVNVSAITDDLYCRMYVFRGVHTGTTTADVWENGVVAAGRAANGVGGTAAVADTAVTTLGADRLALQFVAVDDDNPVGPFTGMSGGTWAEPVAEFASATGTDGCIQLQTATIASAGTIDGGSFTMAAADNWGVVGFALKPLPGGPATHFGATASSYTFGKATAATKKTFAATATPITASITVAGNVPGVTHFGVVAAPFAFSSATAAQRKAFGQLVAPFTFAETTAARRKTFGATATPLAFGEVTAARRQTFGQIVRPFTATIAVAGIVTTGAVTHYGAATVAFTFGELTQARRRTFGLLTVPLAFGEVTAAHRRTFGQVARPVTFGEVTAARRKTFGAVTRPFTVLFVTAGISETGAVTRYGVVTMPLAFTKATQARIGTYGLVTAPFTFTELTQAQRRTFGATAMPITIAFATSGLAMLAPILNYAIDIRWGSVQADNVYVGDELVWSPPTAKIGGERS